MASIRQKVSKAGDLAMYFLEIGRIPTLPEYRASTDVPIRWATLKRFYGNWNRMLGYMENSQPKLWAELQNLGKPVVKPVVVKPVVVKPVTKVAAGKD